MNSEFKRNTEINLSISNKHMRVGRKRQYVDIPIQNQKGRNILQCRQQQNQIKELMTLQKNMTSK